MNRRSMTGLVVSLVLTIGVTAACGENRAGNPSTGAAAAQPTEDGPGRCPYPSIRPTYLPWQSSGEIPEPDHRSYWKDIDRAGLLWTNPNKAHDGVWLTVYPLEGDRSPEEPIGVTIQGATGYLHDGPHGEHSAWWDLDERCNFLELSVSLQGMSPEAVDEEVVKIARSLEERSHRAEETPCQFDACGRGAPLEDGESWSGSVLQSAGFAYVNEYRDDGGGGHVVPAWNLMISVLPPEEDPSAWALSHEYRPYWESNGTTVFGAVKESSQVGYFYWQAGGVDSAVQVGWDAKISKPQDVRDVIEKIVAEQMRNEYP